MHEVHVLLGVNEVGGSTMYQPWWTDVWLYCFCDAAAQVASGTPGKQQTACVCVSVALDFCACLSQPEHLEVTWVFYATMMRSALEHCIFKILPDCSHEHPNCMPSFAQNNWPKCLINMLANACAYTLSCLSNSSHLVPSRPLNILISTSPRAT